MLYSYSYHPRYRYGKGVTLVYDTTISFILSILASVVAYYICKWLDEEENSLRIKPPAPKME